MEISIIVKSILILGIGVSLLYAILKLLQKYTKIGGSHANLNEYGIKINNVAYIDAQNKLINFSCANKTYLILIGKNRELIIDKYETHSNTPSEVHSSYTHS